MRFKYFIVFSIILYPNIVFADFDCSKYVMGTNYQDDAYCGLQKEYKSSEAVYTQLINRLNELEEAHSNPDSIRGLIQAVEGYNKSLSSYAVAFCDLDDYVRYFPGYRGSGSSAAQASCIKDKTKELTNKFEKLLKSCTDSTKKLKRQCL
jgi:hypothetical protein